MIKKLIASALIGALMAVNAFAGAETGNWKRPNGDLVDVKVVNNGFYCTITSGKKKGFEMCHGMAPKGADIWSGKTMKHPSMPGFMTFNGTVKITGNNLEIKGCAIGNGMCDKEKWVKQ